MFPMDNGGMPALVVQNRKMYRESFLSMAFLPGERKRFQKALILPVQRATRRVGHNGV
jgi:hypothetical protein